MILKNKRNSYAITKKRKGGAKTNAKTRTTQRVVKTIVKYNAKHPIVKKRIVRKVFNGKKQTLESAETMIYGIADQLLGNKSFDKKVAAIRLLLDGEFGVKYRSALVGNLDADGECKSARTIAMNAGETRAPAYDYKDKNARAKSGTLFKSTERIITNNDQSKGFISSKRGECGKCWLCGINVYHYKNNKGQETSCGDCEHIGGILAPFLTGMLTSSELDIQMWNYGSSHIHCNRQKSDTISMWFNPKTAMWELEKKEVKKLINAITEPNSNNKQFHASEYDYMFKRDFSTKLRNDKIKFKDEIYKNIEEVTMQWCLSANTSIVNIAERKKKVSYKLIEKIRVVSIELMRRTKFYRELAGTNNGGGTPQPMVVSNDSSVTHNTTDNETKQIFNKSIIDQLRDINNDLSIRENMEFLENLQKARMKTVRLSALNNTLLRFSNELMDTEVSDANRTSSSVVNMDVDAIKRASLDKSNHSRPIPIVS